MFIKLTAEEQKQIKEALFLYSYPMQMPEVIKALGYYANLLEAGRNDVDMAEAASITKLAKRLEENAL